MSTDKIDVGIKYVDEKQASVEISPLATVGELKKQIEEEEGILASTQSLMMDGRELENRAWSQDS